MKNFYMTMRPNIVEVANCILHFIFACYILDGKLHDFGNLDLGLTPYPKRVGQLGGEQSRLSETCNEMEGKNPK